MTSEGIGKYLKRGDKYRENPCDESVILRQQAFLMKGYLKVQEKVGTFPQ